jgi:tRNA 5-methylaminomethyl-2-thiouridine biosynthesis bifunctional protein
VIEPARLAFSADGTPFSETYGDVYHTRAGGLGQARHVFLGGNDLPQRWRGRERFVIVETGFGLGVNFLATWAAWRNDVARCGELHFVSFEKHPLAVDDLASAHAAILAADPDSDSLAELAALAAELCSAWPPLAAGKHTLHFAGGALSLSLIFADATSALPQSPARADAFYLDGFSPAKNPALWTPELLCGLSRLAAPGATLATWSVAAGMRRSLAASGWRLEKAPGFCGKREMLRGVLGDATGVARTQV